MPSLTTERLPYTPAEDLTPSGPIRPRERTESTDTYAASQTAYRKLLRALIILAMLLWMLFTGFEISPVFAFSVDGTATAIRVVHRTLFNLFSVPSLYERVVLPPKDLALLMPLLLRDVALAAHECCCSTFSPSLYSSGTSTRQPSSMRRLTDESQS